MGLSSPQVDEPQAEATLRAALEAGVSFFDTADVYAPEPKSIGHSERLLARVLGDAEVKVATKGGLVRDGRRWRAQGRARHLRKACEESLARLGRTRHDVYFLHAPDTAVPLETSVRALAAAQKAGLIQAIGLSNVTVSQLERALRVVDIEWVQLELGVLSTEAFESGVPERCRELGIRIVAHRPLGGTKAKSKLGRHGVLKQIALAHPGTTPADVALAWLYDLHPSLVALPGATRPETAERAVPTLKLSDNDRARLDECFPQGRLLRRPRAERRPRKPGGDVVIVMGMPGSGKSTWSKQLVERNYLRLNRDEHGGRLAGLIPLLEAALADGKREIVLDNTYPSRAQRNRVIEAAWRHGAAVRCVWVDTPLEQSQVQAILRMLDRHGRLLDVAEVEALGKSEPNSFLPRVQFAYRERLEAPSEVEGFETVERARPEIPDYGNRAALFIDAEQFLWPADGRLDDSMVDALQGRLGFSVVGALSWQPGIDHAGRARLADHCQTLERKLGVRVELLLCPHPAGPPRCWCRRPLPGLGLVLQRGQGVALRQSWLLGDGAANRGFAARLGLHVATAPGELPQT